MPLGRRPASTQVLTAPASHAGGRARGAEPEQRDDPEGEQDLLAQVGRLERLGERGEHSVLLRRWRSAVVVRAVASSVAASGAEPHWCSGLSRVPGGRNPAGRDDNKGASLGRRGVPRPQRMSDAPRSAYLRLASELGDLAPGRGDLLLRRGGERVRASPDTATEISPLPSTFTGCPCAHRALGDQVGDGTSPPSGNSVASLARLTTWYSTRNGFLKPRSLGSRMCSGICPPSKRSGTW